ncbi:scarecrow-like protein 32 [Silene latifolia]|uniref:scarecrow-like protein 32 n=1 Tax=Silene latifolia TaxID=37657 RepID=UPI003D7711C3
MMQFTEIPTFLPSNSNQTTMINKQPQSSSSLWHNFPTLTKSSLTNNLSGNTNCMEQLLVHCAQAIENNDPTPAQQILWVLNNIAPPDGDSNQRLICAFLRALILRVTRTPGCKFMFNNNNNENSNNPMVNNYNIVNEKLSLLELANFVHLTPWYRFGFTAANSIIIDAIESMGLGDKVVVHIVDVSITQCMQIPTLIDLISTRFQPPQCPPVVRLTVGVVTEHVPPMFDCLSYDDVGLRLINFARSKGVVLEFEVVHTTPLDGFASLIDQVRRPSQHHQDDLCYTNDITQELLVFNCHMTLHYLQQLDDIGDIMSTKTIFLKELRSLEPDIVVIVEEDVDFTSRNLVERLKSAFNYFWIPFDTVDTFLPKWNKQRECYEADICWKIENVISYEGGQRVERQEPRGRWAERMVGAGFRAVEFGEETVTEVKGMVEEHGVGWGSKKEEEHLVLTWKGHNVAFASAWLPS